MVIFNTMYDILNSPNVLSQDSISYKGLVYKKVRINENISRGTFDNLTCIDFRCESENHNLRIFYNDGEIYSVETGYSIS